MKIKLIDVAEDIFAGGDVPKDRFSEIVTDEYKIPIYANAEKDNGLYGYTDVARVSVPCVTVAARGTIGFTAKRTEPFLPVVRLITVIPNGEKITLDYLYYALRNCRPKSSGTSIPQLTVPDIKNYSFEIASISRQEKITRILDEIERLIERQRKQMDCYDRLIKSRFVEMFGDMFQNTKRWPESRLELLADLVSGITKGRKVKDIELQEVPYMAVSNVKDGYIDWTTVKTIMATKQEIEQYRLLPDDVLMTEGGDPDKVGRGAIIKEPLENSIHQNHIFRVRLNRKYLLPIFFEEYLQHQKAKRYFLGCAKQRNC